ncbi:MAG: tRNA dimethylallyltransferase [Marinoscillum sp.]|jgi:tRNA dimethylallyltransferase
MHLKKNILVSIVGPTAVGKTAMAIELAKHFHTDVVSADSRQFYGEMNIGTAKPTDDELSQAKHYFIDNLSIHDEYTAGLYERDALKLLGELFEKHDVVVLVGGSGLFVKALWEGLDDIPKVATEFRVQLNREFQENGLEELLSELEISDPTCYEEIDRANHQRVIRALEVVRGTGKPFSSFKEGKKVVRPFENIKIGLNMNRELLFERIDSRMDAMIQAGLFEEAKALQPFQALNALQTVGYSEIFEYFTGEYDKEEAIRLLKRNSRRYAKRQMTWFTRDEEVKWYKPDDLQQIIQLVQNRLDT